jgi:hypothetical protein
VNIKPSLEQRDQCLLYLAAQLHHQLAQARERRLVKQAPQTFLVVPQTALGGLVLDIQVAQYLDPGIERHLWP